MTNDDDDALGIDLDAWLPPPPPPGIAAGVLARMREETTSVTPQAVPVEPARPSTRRGWIVAGAVVAAAIAAVVMFGVTRAPANGSGQVVATRPAHLALGPSSADLDARTVVTWRRSGHRLVAQQAGGAAQWRVDDDDTLTIETALGSIEATDASLRVEVKMLDEKKTIALSAVTAAAVAVVTIVVYEGTVRIRDAAASHEVRAGAAYQIKATGDNTIEIEEETPVVGAAPIDDALTRAQIAQAMDAVEAPLRACADGYSGVLSALVAVDAAGTVTSVTMTPRDAAPSACVARLLAGTKFTPTRTGGTFRYPFRFTVARCDADAMIAEGTDALANMDLERSRERFEAAYACRPSTDALKRVVLLACKMKDIPRVRRLFQQNPAHRDFILAACANNGVSQDTFGSGKLKVMNTVPAKVLVDGDAVGITPLVLDLAPGNHRVTFVVGDDRHTFTVRIGAGAEVVLRKDITTK